MVRVEEEGWLDPTPDSLFLQNKLHISFWLASVTSHNIVSPPLHPLLYARGLNNSNAPIGTLFKVLSSIGIEKC